MKSLTVIFVGQDAKAARALAATIRGGEAGTLCADGYSDVDEVIECDKVVIMPDVPWWRRDKIAATYPGKVVPAVGTPPLATPQEQATIIATGLEPPGEYFDASVTRGLEPKRRRGRPPGSKNKPKAA